MKIRCVPLLAVALLALEPVRLAAQDVTVTDPVWFLPDPAPDEMPHAKSKLRPDYPDEMRKTSQLGYVLLTRYVDADGKNRSMRPLGTQAVFERAVEMELHDWQMTPAKSGGQPVNAYVWVAVIFNPKSAATKGAEATPRLLAIAPAITKEQVAPAGSPPVVPMRVTVDATGAITSAMPEGTVKESLLPAVQDALKAWRFAPARAGGQPVAAEIVVPVLCARPSARDLAKRTPPKVLKQVPPVYPVAMRRYAVVGETQVNFQVDVDGKVLDPVVLVSSNPAFDEPAIEAVKQWQFEPGASDGKPIKSRMQVQVRFNLIGDRGTPAYRVSDQTDQSKLPSEFRYDTAAKIRGVFLPVYPYALRHEGVRGAAKVLMLVDRGGRVMETKVQSADRPEFGLALAAALENFTFDPALKDGKPVPHLLNFEQQFNERDLPDDAGEDLLSLEKKHPEKILSGAALDAPLKPISRRSPRFPVAAKGEAQGQALVEILVDKKGRARLPRVVSATSDAFGYAAAQAVATWWFEPPLSGGKPVVVRARVPVNFSTKTESPAPKPVEAEK